MQVLLSESDSGVRVGFTATKKLGGAVVRNRVKRRLKAAIRELLPQSNAPGGDYVFIARKELETCAYDILLRDMRYALKNTHKAKKDTRS